MVIVKGFIKCILYKHDWVLDDKRIKECGFIKNYSTIFHYEKCTRCGKKRNNSPFSESITTMIENNNIMACIMKEKYGTSCLKEPI